MDIKLEEITVFNDLRERLQSVTAEQITASERRMCVHHKHAPSEKVIGTVESITTKALYALWTRLQTESILEMAQSHHVVDEVKASDHKQKAAVLDMLGDVAKELFWAQAKVDLGFHEPTSVGIRPGWVLVVHEESDGPGAALAGLLRLGKPPE